MSSNQILESSKKNMSREACTKFLDELVSSPLFDKIKPADYSYNDYWFLLSDHPKPSLKTFVHLVNGDNIIELCSPIRFYENNHGGIIIEILDERFKLASGFISSNNDFTFMQYNNSLHTLEFNVDHNSIKTKVVIFSHFFVE